MFVPFLELSFLLCISRYGGSKRIRKKENHHKLLAGLTRIALINTAIQCLSFRFQRYGRPICLGRFVYHILGEQGRPQWRYEWPKVRSGRGRLMANGHNLVSLRIQTTSANKADFPSVSPER